MDPPQLPSSLRDPAKLFYQKDNTRRSIVIAYWSLIILAIPLWWYTTSIERLSLPSHRVHQQAENHLQLPVRICLQTVDEHLFNSVRTSLVDNISREPQRWRGLTVDVFRKASCESPRDNFYTIIFKDGPVSIRNRHLYFPPNSLSELVDTLCSLLVPYSGLSDRDHRVAQYSPHYRLAFSLLNEDAAAGNAVLGWNIRGAIKTHIQPILRRLSTLHNFTIESQVQFHAPLAFTPVQTEQAFGITPEDLTVFVNSAEWTLSSSSSNDPVLHFILFIPSAERRPLDILKKDGGRSASNAFLLPQWGGIIIHNPPLSNVQSADLSPQDANLYFSSFSNQLLALLGVAKLPPGLERSNLDALSDWQLDALLRRRTFENAQGSQDTLLSIVKLIDRIDSMPIGEDVRDDVQNALYSLTKMFDSSSKSLHQAFTYSAEALSLASRAFFNPGMLALLYFPAEHKYAVYTPLFASAIIPLAVAALREIIAWRRERKVTELKPSAPS
ncbi:hypothetical protein BYT27DRAFT_7081680 [Phlegmacium glaucopus]|nr:hypothetical protein BYT27DRAFT_7081680 [Phlegmacium glaucopus]